MSVVTTLETEEFATPTLYPHPILKVTTIPYDFHNINKPQRLKDRPTKQTIARVSTTILVSCLIFIIWLLVVQCFKLLVLESPPSHHGYRAESRSAGGGPQPIIAKPTTGYTPSSNYRSRSPTYTYTVVQRPIITADR